MPYAAAFFSALVKKRLLCGKSSATGAVCACVRACVCVRATSRNLWPHQSGSKKEIKRHYRDNRSDKYSLRVEHAGADDELEDVLEGFEGSEDGLTLFPSTRHIQIPLQYGHQLSGRE